MRDKSHFFYIYLCVIFGKIKNKLISHYKTKKTQNLHGL